MEIAILTGLAYIGYELSKDKTPRLTEPIKLEKTKRNNKFPFSDDEKLFHQQHKPFFTERKVHSNDVQKQRRMETFTGTDSDVFWKRKTEVENMFKPTKDLTNIHGSQINNDESTRYSNSLTNIMKGVSPIEKIHVGRGLNKGADVAASGGFHEDVRILPDNVNSYKKNSFGGRIIPGKGVNYQRDYTPSIEDNNKPERFYTKDQRDTLATRSQYTKQENRGQVVLRNTCKTIDCGTIGIAHGEFLAPTEKMNSTRDYDSTKCNIIGNPHMQVLGNNPQIGQYIMPAGERENCGAITNAYSNQGNIQHYSNGANPTLREDVNNHQGNISSVVTAGGHTLNNYNVNPTLRGSTNDYEGHAYNSQLNAPGHVSSTYSVNTTNREELGANTYQNAPKYTNGHSNRNYEANPTQRQSTHSSYTGIANSNHKGTTNQFAMKHSQPYSKREDVQKEYIPNGGGMNLREDAIQMLGTVQLPSDCNSHPINHGLHAQASSIYQYGNMEHATKLPIHNTRNDFKIATNVLRNNAFSHSVI
jgi:hypothetical protein